MTDEEMGFKDVKSLNYHELQVEAHDHALTLESIYPFRCGSISRRLRAIRAELDRRDKMFEALKTKKD